MKRFAIISCNINCNFTNYGSALQTYALQTAINRIAPTEFESIVLDYCPDTIKGKDIRNPLNHMWDTDEVSQRMCRLTLPAIRSNADKFDRFYNRYYKMGGVKYGSNNLNESKLNEALDGYIIGSDTVFCIDEFGFDKGYYADFPEMQDCSVSYAASFGDSHFSEEKYKKLNSKLRNFKALGIREEKYIPYIKEHSNVPVSKTIDPTLLLKAVDYEVITAQPESRKPYLLMYARRYNPKMEKYARKVAADNGWDVVEISLRATNCDYGHDMRYDAGVEEFLALVKNAEMVITNSFHGLIFSVQFRRPFIVFSRESADNKIQELLELFGIHDRMFVTGDELEPLPIDYDSVHARIDEARAESMEFLKKELTEYI